MTTHRREIVAAEGNPNNGAAKMSPTGRRRLTLS